MSLVCELFGAISDGISKAAERLCPMDHTGARRAQAVCDAAEAADELTELTEELGLYESEPPTNYLTDDDCLTFGCALRANHSCDHSSGSLSPSPERPNLTFPNPDEMAAWPDSLLLTHAANCMPFTPENYRLVDELRERAEHFEAIERAFPAK